MAATLHEMPFQLSADASQAGHAALLDYLVRRGLAQSNETLRVESAGPSNMNCVRRVRLPGRSLILKQARPWVEKYPSIAAPLDRSEAEARFYRLVATVPEVAAGLPGLLAHFSDDHLSVFEDVAPAESLEGVYRGETLGDAELIRLAGWLAALHRVVIPEPERASWRNAAMRELNHAHIFDLPLRADGVFDALLESVTPGLASVAGALRADQAFVAEVASLGRRYLTQDLPGLIHGDFFPGSILRRASGELCVIDPEFCFGGDPEWDTGVFYAHLLLSGQTPVLCERWLHYTALAGPDSSRLAQRYAGVEIMRRLIGVAQLPLTLSLAEKRAWLERSRRLVLGESRSE